MTENEPFGLVFAKTGYINSGTGVHSTVQGVLLGHPIHTISYIIPRLPTDPLKKGNSQMDSSVQDNLAALSRCQ
jgi:hypothetical protein